MSEIFVDIKEVGLKNNCPECYNKDGLRLKFKQKIIETKFHKSITSEIDHEITCKTCNSTIYPEQWTDDIERAFEYQKRAFVPKQSSTYLKKVTWLVLGLTIGISILLIGIIFYSSL